MFNNTGNMLKIWAQALFAIEVIASVISGLIMIFNNAFLPGIFIVIGGIIAAWISSCILYGFGEIIDKLCEIERNTRPAGQSIAHTDAPASLHPVSVNAAKPCAAAKQQESTASGWTCSCGSVNASYVSTCTCGLSKYEASMVTEQNDK